MKRRHGTALIGALIMVGIVAIAISVVSVGLGIQITRARQQIDSAQLRQLLLSGAQAAPAHLGASGTVDLPLPRELQEAGATLHLTIDPENGDHQTIVTVQAALPHSHLAETLRYRRTDSGWTLAAAELQ